MGQGIALYSNIHDASNSSPYPMAMDAGAKLEGNRS